MHEILRRKSLKWFYLSKYAKMLLLDSEQEHYVRVRSGHVNIRNLIWKFKNPHKREIRAGTR